MRRRDLIDGRVVAALPGIASLAFGRMMLAAPAAAALAVVWFVGAYAPVFGMLLIAPAFRLRGLGRAAERQMIAVEGSRRPSPLDPALREQAQAVKTRYAACG